MPPGGSRTGPMLEEAAQQSIAAARQQAPRLVRPPEYEPAVLSAEERAEAEQVEERDVLCGLRVGITRAVHGRVPAAGLRGARRRRQGQVRALSGPENKWADGRVVFHEDTKENERTAMAADAASLPASMERHGPAACAGTSSTRSAAAWPTFAETWFGDDDDLPDRARPAAAARTAGSVPGCGSVLLAPDVPLRGLRP